ncbi:MAG: VOC family protein [Chloroflexota bacterium]
MKYTRTGLILCTENYQACVDFYTQMLELPVMHAFDNDVSKLTCLDMGSGNYLMIETGGTAIAGGKSLEQNPIYLRFNVEDVEAAAAELSVKGMDVTVNKAEWGTTASFTDPDGNHCSLRDEATF